MKKAQSAHVDGIGTFGIRERVWMVHYLCFTRRLQMGGDDTGRTGHGGSPLSPIADVAGRERKRSLFADWSVRSTLAVALRCSTAGPERTKGHRLDADPGHHRRQMAHRPALGRVTILTLSRDRWLVLEMTPRLLPIGEPAPLYRVMTARASRSALAIAADPDSCGPQGASRRT